MLFNNQHQFKLAIIFTLFLIASLILMGTINQLNPTLESNHILDNVFDDNNVVIDGNNAPVLLNDKMLQIINRNKLNVPNLTIINAPGSIVENLSIVGQYINLTNSPGSIIRNNVINDIIQTSTLEIGVGIYVQNSSNTLITNNKIFNIVSEFTQSIGILVTESNGVQILNNFVSGVSSTDNTDVSETYGIKIDNGSDNSLIAFNNLDNINSQNAPAFGIMTSLVTNVTIFDNQISSVSVTSTGAPDSMGIHIRSSSEVLIQRNSIQGIDATTATTNDAQSYGIYIISSLANIADNDISSIASISLGASFSYGIFSDNGSLSGKNNRVTSITSGGLTNGNSYGIYYFQTNNTLKFGPNIFFDINANNNAYDVFLDASYNNKFIFVEGFQNNIAWQDSSISSIYTMIELFQDGISVAPGQQFWLPSDISTIDSFGLPLGDFDYFLNITGGLTDILVYINISVIQNLPPTINSPTDITIEEANDPISFLWSVTDTEQGNYSVFLNGSFIQVGSWYNGELINVTVDDVSIWEFSVGTYEFLLQASDIFGLSNSDSYIITVQDTTAPIITGPDTFEIEEQTNGSIPIQITEKNLDSIIIYKNGGVVENNSGIFSVNVNITLVKLSADEYNFTIVARDRFGNSASHTIKVFSLDVTAPEIRGPDRIFFLKGTPNQQIEWEVFDYNPGNFSIYRNGYFVKNGSWIDTDKITFPLDNLQFGVWNYTLMLEDQFNHTSYNSISVTVGITKETSTNATVNDLLFGFDSNIVIGGALIGVGTAVVGGIVFLVRRR